MPTYLIFFESQIISSYDIWFDFENKSVVTNKISCSFLDKENSDFDQDIQKSLSLSFPDCEVIEFGKIILSMEREFTVFFTVFSTKENLFNNINGRFYPPHNYEESKKILLEIRNSLSRSINILVVKRFVSNIFLPDKLKDFFKRTIEENSQKIMSRKERSNKRYYQNYMRFPFLIEFQTNLNFNFEEEFKKIINDYYTILSPLIYETGSLIPYEFSFCELKPYPLEKFERDTIADLISKSFLEYIPFLYGRIIDNLTIYQKRIDVFSKKIDQLSGKVLIKLNEQLNELKSIVFEEDPLLYLRVLDKYILYEEDEENPDLTDQIFRYGSSSVSVFRRKLLLLREKITIIQSEIKTSLLYKQDRITSYTKEELKVKLNEIENEQEFQELLAEILENLGYENIKINCGTRAHDEQGKDIVFPNVNKFGSREWNAVIVKIGKIRAEEGRELYRYVRKIIDQGMDALETEYEDDKGSKFSITRIFIAVNETITDSAKKAIRKKMEGQVFFIDKETLLNKCL